ncbi:MAG TPA: succinate dehydrogenase assembly factor 2 [Methyloceanibacter sp.]|nr:succinate dehydrogenase assembly factor 2 [Methyloceanibacter sp.]
MNERWRSAALTGIVCLRSKLAPMPNDDLAMRRRRALYRATHRGSKELDFLLGRFAERNIETMSDAEIGVLERLIEVPDPEIAESLFEGNSLEEPALDTLMRRLRCFHGIVQGGIKSC